MDLTEQSSQLWLVYNKTISRIIIILLLVVR